MSKTQRAALLGVAAIVLLAALLTLRPTDDAATPTRSDHTTPTSVAADDDGTDRNADRAAAKPATPSPAPLLRAGSAQRLDARSGETVHFRVRSTAPDKVHVHGYDLLRNVAPDQTTVVAFEANLEGIFEIELEQAGEQIGELRVAP